MNRTEFLIQNPKLITALGIRQGIPYRELDDFRQEVLLASIVWKDKFNPKKAKMSTYAGTFVKFRAVDYLRKLKRVPQTLADLENPTMNRDS